MIQIILIPVYILSYLIVRLVKLAETLLYMLQGGRHTKKYRTWM